MVMPRTMACGSSAVVVDDAVIPTLSADCGWCAVEKLFARLFDLSLSAEGWGEKKATDPDCIPMAEPSAVKTQGGAESANRPDPNSTQMVQPIAISTRWATY